MHPAIIIGTVRSLWTWLWGRYHVPQNVFLVINVFKHQKCKYFVIKQNKLGHTYHAMGRHEQGKSKV